MRGAGGGDPGKEEFTRQSATHIVYRRAEQVATWPIRPETEPGARLCSAGACASLESVPLPIALRVLLGQHLQVVEVEVGRIMSRCGQHQSVQALVTVQTPQAPPSSGRSPVEARLV